MHEAHWKKIEEIMDAMQCPKGFQCRKDGFTTVCKVKDQGMGLNGCVLCFDEAPGECAFALSFGDGHLCRCPLRVFVAHTLRI